MTLYQRVFLLCSGVEYFPGSPWLWLRRCSCSHCLSVLMFNKCQCPEELLSLLSLQSRASVNLTESLEIQWPGNKPRSSEEDGHT